MLERFRTGEVRLLIACKSMDEGVDVPDAAVGIILSGTPRAARELRGWGVFSGEKMKAEAPLCTISI